MEVLVNGETGQLDFDLSGLPTPMISLVKKAKALPTRFGGARVQVLFDSSARLVASRPWFLLVVEPDTHLLSQLVPSFHRGLSWYFPASLETNQREPPELALLRPVGKKQDLAGGVPNKSVPFRRRYATARVSFLTTRKFL